MNYDKKRKRNRGRQARKVQDTYQVWIDDKCNVHAKLIKGKQKTMPSETPEPCL